MTYRQLRACVCGSDQPRIARCDARGIFLCYACAKCWPEKQKGYRPEVLTDPNYSASEAIDDD